MKICVIGLGYIGLPTAIVLARHRHRVVGVDVNPQVVASLNEGRVHLEEPGLNTLLEEAIREKSFRAGLMPERADAFIIAVPTPGHDDAFKGCDLSYVLAAVRSVVPYLEKGNRVIIESTVAPLTTSDAVKPIIEAAGFTVGSDIYLAHCPERVLPGHILKELIENNRIIGGITPACAEAAAVLYRTFVQGELILTQAKTAEMAKCMENTFRDVNIALANELALICNQLNINALDVIRLANKHPRVNIHQPGPGVGGHCLAVDPYFIYAAAPDQARMIKLARDINSAMPSYVVGQVSRLLEGIDQPRIAVFGVTYKGNTDDIRESPALEVLEQLKALYGQVRVYDPHVSNEAYVSCEEAIDQAHLIIVLSDHNEFKQLDHAHIAARMARPLLFDTKNCVTGQPDSGLRLINFGSLYQWPKEDEGD